MNDFLRELGLVAVLIVSPTDPLRRRYFVVNVDHTDPAKPDVHELERRVKEWERESQ